LKYLNSLKTNGKDSDNQGIFAKFAPKIMIVYEENVFLPTPENRKDIITPLAGE
jgi:hypothetical protein